MNNDPDHLRAALEPHGYVIDRMSDGRARKTNWGRKWLTAILHPNHHGGRIPLAGWENALIHFLHDKSQTGARMAAISRLDAFYGEWEDLAIGIKTGSNPDESVAAVWLRLNGLEDPRKTKVTAP